MEFENYTCPLCNNKFISGDDVVVCPECGTPHHRECYEKNGHCFYADKHKEGFSFEESASDNKGNEGKTENNTVVCPNCRAENPKTTFYCQKCGFPLADNMKNNANSAPGQQNQQPYNNMPQGGAPYMGAPFIIQADPMAGFQSEEPVSENVTAGELAKYVGKNTNYFMRIFRSILQYDKSRFNFAAFFLSGAYFLYRKMYALGVIFTAIMLAVTVSSIFIQLTPEYYQLYSVVMANAEASISTSDWFTGMSQGEIMFFLIPSLLELIDFGVSLTAGLIANRRYFKHCIEKIKKIKSENAVTVCDSSTDNSVVNTGEKIENAGGVNLPVAVAVLAVFVAINYIPLFL